jgi:hypothetical protein
VQKIIPLPYDSALKYTIARYYTPSGRCIQAVRYTGGRDVAAQDTALRRERADRETPRKTDGDGREDKELNGNPLKDSGSGLDPLPGVTQKAAAEPPGVNTDVPRKSAGTSSAASESTERSVFTTLYRHRPVLDKGGIEPDLLLPTTPLGLSQNVFLGQGTYSAFAQVLV